MSEAELASLGRVVGGARMFLRSCEQRVPDAVFAQPPDRIAIFLRHLWATNGSIRAAAGYPIVRFESAGERLAHDVRALLLRLGINARVKRVPMPGRGPDSHRLDVTGHAEVQRFLTTVGGVGASGSARSRRISGRPGGARVNRRAMHSRIGTSYLGETLYRSGLSRACVLQVADAVACDTLRDLARSDVYWDEIVAIEPDGEEEVYDLTVEGLHSFVADDIVVHNSLEQDADLVLFIYRDEYYQGEESDQQGLAELILSKHRNGPTGTIKLSFLKRYAKFADLAA